MPSRPSLPISTASSRTGTSPDSNHSATYGRSRCSPNCRTMVRSSMSSAVSSESRSSRFRSWWPCSNFYTVTLVRHRYPDRHERAAVKADAYRAYGPATRAIHAGYRPDPATGAVNAPIYASSTFAQDGVGGLRGGFEYARTGNPTRAALEASLAAVEGGTFGRAFASGMAATDCALRAMLRPGDHVVIPDDAYGGTFRLIDKVFTKWGIDHTPAALSDLDAVRAAMTAEDQADLGRDADQPAAVDRRHRRRSRSWRRRRGRRCWWTTPSPHPRCSSRWRWAPTSCCTRRRSTSAGTPTWSAARW